MTKSIYLIVSLQIFALFATANGQDAGNSTDADVCNNPDTAKPFGEEWCKKLTTTEACRLGIVNLLFAAANGDKESLMKYKEGGMDMSLVDYDGRSALHLAVSEGHLGSVEYLLTEAKVPSKPKDRWGNLPIDEAMRFGHMNIVEYLNKFYESEQSETKE